MNKLKIFVCCHKEGFYISNEHYIPIHVGAVCSKLDLGIARDDTGLNISAKNANYCELTAQYWIWKNVKDAEYVGLCHYRRYLDLSGHGICKEMAFVSEDTVRNNIKIDTSLLEKYDVIASKPLVEIVSLKDAYCLHHISTDFQTLEEVVNDLYPDYAESFRHVMRQNNRYSMANMLVTSKKIFDEYSEWLFNILFEVERRIEISKDPYQARVFGFMSERLMNVFIYHHHLKVLGRTVMTVDQQPNDSILRDVVGNYVKNLLFKINNVILNRKR